MNMKLLLFAFVLLLFSGCSGEEMENGERATGLKDVKVNLTFAISDGDSLVTRSIAFMPEGKNSVAPDTVNVLTRALSVDENLISTLWVGQYDLSGNLLVSQYLTNITGNQVNFQLKESPECSLRFVANAGDLGKISKLTDFNVKKVTYTADNTCPMFGSLDNQYVSVSYSPSVTMERMLAHIQLVYKMDAGFSFTVKSVSIKSIPVQIQCVEPAGQISGMTYQNISGTVSQSGATVDWYIPENKAGVIKSGEVGFATSDRGKCGGTTVPNATYIEIMGDATVKGVAYTGVAFRMYPGNDINDYMIKRNSPYKVNLTLSGIDFSDPRVSVVVPDIVAPKALDAAKNSTTSLQVTARPGADWSITLPVWLSALVDGKTTGAGGKINYTGPTSVGFTAITANPGSAVRSEVFTFSGKTATVTQNGSVLNVSTTSLNLDAKATSGNVGTFTATKGLSWNLTKNMDWLTVNPVSGTENATGAAQTITYSAPLNTGNSARSGTITIKAGNGQGTLSKTINVSQAASVYTGIAASVELASAGVTKTFLSGTEGLGWKVTIASNNGLTITPTSGNFPTLLSIGATKNPGTAKRLASITVAIPDKSYSQVVSIFQYGTPPAGSTVGTMQASSSATQKFGYNWDNAVSYCNNLVSENFDDWRLPDDTELVNLFNSALKSPYNGADRNYLWGTRPNGTNARVYSYDKRIDSKNPQSWMPKSNKYNVRCVRTVK
ncbi:MAG: BACON domain-containing protein [Parabacteroides gordonii]|uniref:BACON domain-containing protein n=1 Tax=Parabacteroides gordonii TaxID=574930 RepID=UPI003A83A3FB